MATTKRRPTARKSTTTKRVQSPAKKRQSARQNPYVKPAIATGAVAAIAAAAAGFWFFRNSDKTISENIDALTGRIKDGVGEAKEKASGSFESFKEKAAFFFDDDDDDLDQNEIMEEALSLKETAPKSKVPVDPVIEKQTKAGAVAY